MLSFVARVNFSFVQNLCHLLLLLLFAKLEKEWVDAEGEVEEKAGGKHQDDGQGPGKSRGDDEVVSRDGQPEDGANPEANVSGNPDCIEEDQDGRPPEDSNQPNESQEKREQADGNGDTSTQLHLLFPICRALLKDVEDGGLAVQLLLGAIHQHRHVGGVEADVEGGQGDGGDVE